MMKLVKLRKNILTLVDIRLFRTESKAIHLVTKVDQEFV